MTLRISASSAREDEGFARGIVQSAAARLRGLPPLFVWMVVVPALLATIYWVFIASPIYVSQAQFIVRAPSSSSMPQANGLAAVLQGVGLSPAETDSFIIHDYVMSRDAIAALDAQHHLHDDFGRPGADFLSRFPRPFQQASFEQLAQEYPRFVNVDYNASTGISTLTVKAFQPHDAQEIANSLLDAGEALVNRLNDRADQDAIAETQREIKESESQLALAEQNLTDFRNRERLIDPTRSSAVNLDLMGKLQGEIATLRAERSSIAASAPQSPELPALDSRIHAYEQQAQDETTKMAGETGSLAPMIGEYERLSLERDFAGKTVAAAAEAAEAARLEARRKRLYLERIANPILADSPTEPHRLNSILATLVSLLLAYGTVSLILAGYREHRQR
jgi:capsular polysaccharide transport system permease protein